MTVYERVGGCPIVVGIVNDTEVLVVDITVAVLIEDGCSFKLTLIPLPPLIVMPGPNVTLILYVLWVIYSITYGVLTQVLGNFRISPGQTIRTAPLPPPALCG